MFRLLTAVVLCILAQAASAQCTAVDPATQAAKHDAATVKTKGATPPAVVTVSAPARGGEFIATASAGTYQPAVVRTATVRAADDEGHQQRGGPAMLLAALALMCGIALRRSGQNPR